MISSRQALSSSTSKSFGSFRKTPGRDARWDPGSHQFPLIGDSSDMNYRCSTDALPPLPRRHRGHHSPHHGERRALAGYGLLEQEERGDGLAMDPDRLEDLAHVLEHELRAVETATGEIEPGELQAHDRGFGELMLALELGNHVFVGAACLQGMALAGDELRGQPV